MEIVIKVHDLSTIVNTLSWLKCEPTLFAGLSQCHLAAAVLLGHLLQVQGKVLATEEMVQLDGLPISQFGSQLKFLLVFVIFLLDQPFLLVFFDIILDHRNFLLYLLQLRLVHLIFTSAVVDHLPQLAVQLYLLKFKLLNFLIYLAVLLDFNPEQALLVQIACILAHVVGLWDHIDALVCNAVRK